MITLSEAAALPAIDAAAGAANDAAAPRARRGGGWLQKVPTAVWRHRDRAAAASSMRVVLTLWMNLEDTRGMLGFRSQRHARWPDFDQRYEPARHSGAITLGGLAPVHVAAIAARPQSFAAGEQIELAYAKLSIADCRNRHLL